eukprot:scpid26801/ scgid23170/ Metabotropic glutamate receptor 7
MDGRRDDSGLVKALVVLGWAGPCHDCSCGQGGVRSVAQCLSATLIVLATMSAHTGAADEVMLGPCAPYQALTEDGCSRDEINADLYIGGLFPIHRLDSTTGKCPNRPTLGYEFLQLPEAMRAAVDEINKNPDILPNVTLGYEIRDTCTSPAYALRQSLEFLGRSTNGDEKCTEWNSLPGALTEPNVVGIVGPALSAVSAKTAQLLGLFRIPMISYASTSPRFSKKADFPYFFRTVPSHARTGVAIASIIRKLNWNFVGFVYTSDHYGTDGIATVKNALGMTEASCPVESSMSSSHDVTDLCQSKTWEFEYGQPSNDSRLGDIWNEILYTEPINRSTVIVVITLPVESNYFFNYPRNYGGAKMYRDALERNITFIGSDGWGDIALGVVGSLDLTRGAVSAVSKVSPHNEFRRHWSQLNPARNRDVPWLKDLWYDVFSCDATPAMSNRGSNGTDGESAAEINSTALADDGGDCVTKNNLAKNYMMMSKVPHTYTAVLAMASALDAIYKRCNESKDCLKQRASRDLFSALKTINFTTFDERRFQFDSNGDTVNPIYNIKNIQVPAGSDGTEFTFTDVGHYGAARAVVKAPSDCPSSIITSDGTVTCVTETFYLNESAVTWNSGLSTRPVSMCSEPCPPVGYKRLFGGETVCQTCCWSCKPCPANYYSNLSTNSQCSECSRDETSPEASATCSNVVTERFSMASGVLPFVMVILSALGVTGMIAAILHSLRKARDGSFFVLGKEPTLLCLSGFLLAYLSGLVEIGGPTAGVCFMRVFLSSIGLTAVSSSLVAYALYRVTDVRDMPVSWILALPRYRLVWSLAAEGVTLCLLIISCSHGQCTSAVQTVYDHVRVEQRCGFRSVDTAFVAYLCVLHAVLIGLCVIMVATVKQRGIGRHSAYDLRTRMFPMMSVAAGLSSLLAITFLIMSSRANEAWSPQAEDSVLHVVTLEVATAFFLVVFLQPLRKLGRVKDDDTADRAVRRMGSERMTAVFTGATGQDQHSRYVGRSLELDTPCCTTHVPMTVHAQSQCDEGTVICFPGLQDREGVCTGDELGDDVCRAGVDAQV